MNKGLTISYERTVGYSNTLTITIQLAEGLGLEEQKTILEAINTIRTTAEPYLQVAQDRRDRSETAE